MRSNKQKEPGGGGDETAGGHSPLLKEGAAEAAAQRYAGDHCMEQRKNAAHRMPLPLLRGSTTLAGGRLQKKSSPRRRRDAEELPAAWRSLCRCQ